MKLTFIEPCDIEVVTSVDEETDEAMTEFETFARGDEIDVDVLDINWEFRTLNFQFGDGSVAYGVPMVVFAPMENPEEPPKQ